MDRICKNYHLKYLQSADDAIHKQLTGEKGDLLLVGSPFQNKRLVKVENKEP